MLVLRGGITMQFSLKAFLTAVMLVAVGLAAVAHERALRDRELEVVRELRERATEREDLSIVYTTTFDIEPGYWNLVLHSLRKRLGTQTAYGVCMTIDEPRSIPGEMLAKLNNLQSVSLWLRSPNADLSELEQVENLRNLALYGQYPDDITPLAAIPHLETLVLNVYFAPRPLDGLVRFAILKNLKWIMTSWAPYDSFTFPFRQARPGCKIGPVLDMRFFDE